MQWHSLEALHQMEPSRLAVEISSLNQGALTSGLDALMQGTAQAACAVLAWVQPAAKALRQWAPRLNHQRASLGIAGSAIALSVHAQTNSELELQQRSVEQERRAREALEDRQRRSTGTPDVRLQGGLLSSPALIGSEAVCFQIDEVQLKPEPTRWNWLLDHLDGHAQLPEPDPALGRCLGAQGIQTVIDRLQHALIAKGYVTSRVLATAQDLTSGRLVLQLLPGRISEIKWAEGSGHRGSRWNTVPIRAGDVLNLRDIEQALENYKRVPTAEADLAIEPAAEPGFSNLVISHQQVRPIRLNATVDDSGSRAIGLYQGSFTFSLDNWWTLSDLFYVTWHGDLGGGQAGPRGTRGRTMHYSVPWGYSLLSFTASQSQYHQAVAGVNGQEMYSGTSSTTEAKVSRVVQRDSAGKTTLSLKGFQRRSNNYINDEEVAPQRRIVSGMEWGLGHRRAYAQGIWETNLGYRVGTGAWGALPAPEEAYGEGTSRMRLWLVDAMVQQPFSWLGQRWAYSGSWRGQYNRTPLTPQDRLAIGGRFTVRGFDGLSVLSAERGWLLRNEISTGLAPQIQGYVGLDTGQVAGPSAAQLVGQSLTGGVLGLRGQLGPIGRWGRVQYEVFVGQPLSKPERFKTSATTTGFSLSISL